MIDQQNMFSAIVILAKDRSTKFSVEKLYFWLILAVDVEVIIIITGFSSSWGKCGQKLSKY